MASSRLSKLVMILAAVAFGAAAQAPTRVRGTILGCADDPAPDRRRFDPGASDERLGDSDDKGARTADPRCLRQVARKTDARGQVREWEIRRKPADHRARISAPALVISAAGRGELGLLVRVRVLHDDAAISGWFGRDCDAAGNGSDQRVAPRIVGVLTEHLDAPRYEPADVRQC